MNVIPKFDCPQFGPKTLQTVIHRNLQEVRIRKKGPNGNGAKSAGSQPESNELPNLGRADVGSAAYLKEGKQRPKAFIWFCRCVLYGGHYGRLDPCCSVSEEVHRISAVFTCEPIRCDSEVRRIPRFDCGSNIL